MMAVQEHARRLNDKLRRELGPMVGRLLEEPDVLEIMLNPDGRLWVERLGHEPEPIGTMNAAQAESLMATVASTLRSEMNRENPILECELPLDGSRFEALIPPVVAAPTFTIRRKASKVFTLDDYVADGIMSRRRGRGTQKHPGHRRYRHRQDDPAERHRRRNRPPHPSAPPGDH